MCTDCYLIVRASASFDKCVPCVIYYHSLTDCLYTCAFMKNPNVKADRCQTDSEKLWQLWRNKEWLKILLKNDINSSVTPSINCSKTLNSSSYGKTAKHNMQALCVSKVEWTSFDLEIAQLNDNNVTSLVLRKLLIKEGTDS